MTAMGVPARFVGASLRASRKPEKRDLLFEPILVGFPKRLECLVVFVSAVLSETAGAGNGLIRKGQHRRVKDRKRQRELPFGSDLDGPVERKLAGGQG